MKERMKVIDFKYTVVITTFFFFFIICTLSPISGADWANYLIGKEGFINSIENIYFNDGRIISGFLINFFTYNKFLFNLSFSLLMSAFVYCCNCLLGYVKNKYFYLLPFLGTIIVGTFTFSYNYISVSSTLAYTFPAILTFIYFFIILKKDDNHFKLKEYIYLSLIAIYISLSSIHISGIFLLGNVLFYLYSLKNKKDFDKKYFIIIIIQAICFILALSYVDKELFYNNIINISLSNIPRYIDTIFSKNIVLLLLGAIPINYYLNIELKDFIYKRVIITLFDIILIFSLAYNFFYYSPVNLNLIINKYFGVFAVENWYYIFYFIIYMILFFLSINKFIQNRKVKNFYKLFALLSLLISICLLISPIWDEGNTIFIILFMISSISILLKELDIPIYPKVTIFITISLIIYYLSMFSITKYIDVTREEYIKEQLNANETIIEVKANPIYLVYRYNPVNIFQQRDFKRYYNIPQEKELNVKYLGIFEKIEKKVKEE